jgi:NADP-dependent 3-hydroxy acid dehydrogenase YdfG
MDTSRLFSLEGRSALITGGSRGIGRMIAEGFVSAGVRVYITARKREACDATAAELSKAGHCVSLPGDIATAEGMADVVARLREHEPTLDVLVNNAGAAWGAPFDEFPESGWDKVMDLNLKALFFLTQALAPDLRAAAAGGDHLAKVINIASIDGISVSPQETYSYHASKAGLIHLTKRMALRLIGRRDRRERHRPRCVRLRHEPARPRPRGGDLRRHPGRSHRERRGHGRRGRLPRLPRRRLRGGDHDHARRRRRVKPLTRGHLEVRALR